MFDEFERDCSLIYGLTCLGTQSYPGNSQLLPWFTRTWINIRILAIFPYKSLKTRQRTLTLMLPSSPIKIWGKSVILLSYDREYKKQTKHILLLYIYRYLPVFVYRAVIQQTKTDITTLYLQIDTCICVQKGNATNKKQILLLYIYR